MILNWISESSNTEIANVPGGVLVFKTSPSTTSGLVFIPDVVLVSRNKDYKLISLKDFEVDKYSGWEKA